MNTTLQIQQSLDHLRAGDAAARDDLVSFACDRLRRLTRKMLRSYPGVRRMEETDDVLQNAAIRLCKALGEVTPPSVRDFFRLAALQIRRVLIDLVRHYYGPGGRGRDKALPGKKEGSDSSSDLIDQVPEETDDPRELARWTEFHQQVEALPEEEREVVDLLWYQGLTQAEAAAVLQVSERTVKRRWQTAKVKLYRALGGEMPSW